MCIKSYATSTVGGNNVLFSIVLMLGTSIDDACALIATLQEALEQAMLPRARRVCITVSERDGCHVSLTVNKKQLLILYNMCSVNMNKNKVAAKEL